MLDNFLTFQGEQNGPRRGDKIRVTLGPQRMIRLSRGAWERMGRPEAAELAFDAVERKIAIRPCPPEKANAFRITERERGLARQIHAGAFLTHFKIRTPHTLLFEGPEITPEGALILSLERTTRVGR